MDTLKHLMEQRQHDLLAAAEVARLGANHPYLRNRTQHLLVLSAQLAKLTRRKLWRNGVYGY